MHFPIYLELDGASCLVVGGGKVAVRKVRALASCGARVTVVAPEQDDALSEVAAERILRSFADADLEGRVLVVAATDDAATNARVSALCRSRGIPVNVVDEPSLCTFIFPAIARKGPLTVAVSSGGACPTAARILRDRAAELLADGFVEEVEQLGSERAALKEAWPDMSERRRECERRLAKWNV